MGFLFLQPTLLSLSIIEGATFLIVLVIKDANGNPINMGPLGGADGGWITDTPLCQFKNAYIDVGSPGDVGSGVVTNCPVPTVSWLNAGAGGEIQLLIPGGTAAGATAFVGGLKLGKWDLKIKHRTSGAVDGVARPFQGGWSIDKLVSQ